MMTSCRQADTPKDMSADTDKRQHTEARVVRSDVRYSLWCVARLALYIQRKMPK
jgi:hypothetical protein